MEIELDDLHRLDYDVGAEDDDDADDDDDDGIDDINSI